MGEGELLVAIAKIGAVVFVVGSLLSMGLSFTVSQLLNPLKNAKLVIAVVIVNFVLVPFLAWGTAEVLPLEDELVNGIIILGCVAGAPFLPKEVQAAKGDLAAGVAVMFLLMVVTIVYAPVVLPHLLEGAEVSGWDLASSLIVSMAIPLVIGLLLKANHPDDAPGWAASAGKASGLGGIVLISIGLVLNVKNIFSLIGSWGFLALGVLVLGALVAGYWAGGRDVGMRKVTGLGTAQRNVSAAIVVATISFSGTLTVTYILVGAILLPVILLPIAKWMGGRGADAGDDDSSTAAASEEGAPEPAS